MAFFNWIPLGLIGGAGLGFALDSVEIGAIAGIVVALAIGVASLRRPRNP